MTTVQTSQTKYDRLKWALASVILLAALAANLYFANVMLGVRLLVWLAIVGLVAAVLLTTQRGAEFLLFAREARVELYKVIWPTRQETVQTTIFVIIVVIVTGLMLWGIDSMLLWLVSRIAGSGVV